MKNQSFIEWPNFSFEEIKNYYVENKVARIMYRVLIALLFVPQAVSGAFWQILRLKL